MNNEPTLLAEMIDQMRKRFDEQMWVIMCSDRAPPEWNSSLRFESGHFGGTEQKRCCTGTIIHAPNCKTWGVVS